MPINQDCKLVIRDLFSYDIKSAYPTIMSNMGWDFDDIDLDNKEERNVAIGKSQIGNEDLSSYLIQSAEQLVRFYLSENNVKDENVIITQRDGFIITKMLDKNDEFISMAFRKKIDFIIISPDRNKYLAISDDEVDVKGVPHKYDALNKVYDMFSKLNFYDKKTLFGQLQKIKDSVFDCTDKKFFMIPREERFAIVTKVMATIQVQNDSIFSIDDIDKMKYYGHYFKDFLDSVFLEFY